MDHAITATQKDILHAFDLTAQSVVKEAKLLGEKISELTN
jgi:hypothetical protein